MLKVGQTSDRKYHHLQNSSTCLILHNNALQTKNRTYICTNNIRKNKPLFCNDGKR